MGNLYYCWGVYKPSAVPGASRGVMNLALRAWMWGQVMMGLIKHPADTHCWPGTSKMLTHCSAGSLMHRRSSPLGEGGAGLKHPQRVPWGPGVGRRRHGTHRKGGLCGGTSSKMNEMLHPESRAGKRVLAHQGRNIVVREVFRIWMGNVAAAGV